MAQYKVPQDVEADDKLLGPFTFRQFIYLIVAAGLIALAWALFQVFPLLVIIPVPLILFFGALALPLKKDQPMETYLAAIVSFYLKPRKRTWETGQPESTIQITAPKKVEAPRARDISQEEASHRLSFLAEIVDTEGHAIKGFTSPIKEEVYAEANSTADMFETASLASNNLEKIIQNEAETRHEEAIKQMRAAIEDAETLHATDTSIAKFSGPKPAITAPASSPVIVETNTPAPAAEATPQPEPPQNVVVQPTPPTPEPSPQLNSLAYDDKLSIATIEKEAKRLQKKHDDEVYVSLH